MNWYNPKEVQRMLGVKRYQQHQSNRLSKPKNIDKLVGRCDNRLTRSLTSLREQNADRERQASNRSDNDKRSGSKLDGKKLGILASRENKFSKSFYGSKLMNDSNKEMNCYGSSDIKLKLNNTLDNNRSREMQHNSYLSTIDPGKRSRILSLLNDNKLTHKHQTIDNAQRNSHSVGKCE